MKKVLSWSLMGATLLLLLLLSPLALARGPAVKWDAIQSYAALAVKVTATLTGVLVFTTALVRVALAALRRHVGGSATAISSQRELYEAIEGPLIWLVVLALAAWLPDILVTVGLLPEGTPFTVNWSEIFRP